MEENQRVVSGDGTNHEPKQFTFLEYIDFLVKRKTLFLKIFVASLLLSYLGIYFFIDEQFEATALIIPREEDASTEAGSVLRGLKGLPFGLGPKSAKSEIDLYNTIIYSRTMMEDIIHQFDLLKVYKLDSLKNEDREKAITRLRKEISTKETE